MKKNQLIEIEWMDIVGDSGWLNEAKAAKYEAVNCKSVGYFLNQDKLVIRISDTINCDDKDRTVNVIPLGCIKKIRRLK